MALQGGVYQALLTALLFIYVFFAAVLVAGVRRKLRARLQGRVGPPVWQPILDFLKLLFKKPTAPSLANPVYVSAAVIALLASLAAAALVPFTRQHPLCFAGDIVAFFILLFAGEAVLVVGGLASGNPYSWLSGMRAMLIMMVRELLLAGALLLLYASTQKLSLVEALPAVPPAVAVPLALFFVAFALVLSMSTLFSAPVAETEVLEGYFIEYSGPLLAMAELSHWLLAYAPLALASSLFLAAAGALGLSWLAAAAHLLMLAAFSAVLAVLDAAFARLRIWGAMKLAAALLGALLALGAALLALKVGA
ncbi:MAG: NADH-quinone oxidoreductase subunit H [Thermofilum sp.]|uniref:NADH-quinone oxidoreductase subunit H n=1 Tax=Thermofilum pendens TaxID=2269 RepID=A0A7C4D1A7_THEPE